MSLQPHSPSCHHVYTLLSHFFRVSGCIYKPYFDHVLRRRGIPPRKRVWFGCLTESREACLTTSRYSFETVRAVKRSFSAVFSVGAYVQAANNGKSGLRERAKRHQCRAETQILVWDSLRSRATAPSSRNFRKPHPNLIGKNGCWREVHPVVDYMPVPP